MRDFRRVLVVLIFAVPVILPRYNDYPQLSEEYYEVTSEVFHCW
ncbi:hypothetical protein FM107_16155 [Sphingobacterium sp. JB170]|nr:hypothetical protein FM107_16155 [Sphingobacterium sp. JB170]